jgi:hypothetical protein
MSDSPFFFESKLNVFGFVFVVVVGPGFAATVIEKGVSLVAGVAALATMIGVKAPGRRSNRRHAEAWCWPSSGQGRMFYYC